jgi:hypothetical protein
MSTAKPGSSSSLASQRVLHVMHKGNEMMDVAVYLPRQVLMMQLVRHAP